MTQIWHKYDTNITPNTRLLFPVRIKGSFVGCGCRALLACWPPDAFRGNLLTLTNMHLSPQTLLIPTLKYPSSRGLYQHHVTNMHLPQPLPQIPLHLPIPSLSPTY